jgi:hypothetical protein
MYVRERRRRREIPPYRSLFAKIIKNSTELFELCFRAWNALQCPMAMGGSENVSRGFKRWSDLLWD